ncbi:uncharacterized protein LOC117288984 [Asterias rubens]|uniref:uncharacterized protein LOC117288984 n=1 Tax=Asterias rubens TaxID=7604 RepID=UPI0014555B9F|nr:uncharacterized protein LOC117288984 [Asterias rubens]
MLSVLSAATSNSQRRPSDPKTNEPMQTQSSPASTDSSEDSPVTQVVHTHQSRQRLRPWLENLINEGSVKGLEWIDKEKKLFKIPWKHAGKQDYNQEEDSKIFKLWSLNTGKFKPGVHVPEPAVWKTRLRTALNKLPDIDEVHEKTQLDIPEPYRVYRLLPKKPSNSAMKNRLPTSPTYGQQDSHHRSGHSMSSYSERYSPYDVRPGTYYTDAYDRQNHSSYQQPSHHWYDPSRPGVDYGYQQAYTNCYPNSTAADLDMINDVITRDIDGNHGHHPPSHAHYPPGSGHVYGQEGSNIGGMEHGRVNKLDNVGMTDTLVNNNDPRHVNYHDLVAMPTVTSSGYTTCATTSKSNPPPSYESSLSDSSHSFPTTCAVTMAMESVSMDDTTNHQLQPAQHHEYSSPANAKRMLSSPEPTLPAEHVMSIQISYQSTDAGYQCVENPAGCVLFFNQPWEEGMQRGMEAIHLPDVGAVPAQPGMTDKQISLTAEVLRCFERGMSIESRNGNIYVTRRCRSVVFWCTLNANEKPTKLERDEEIKVFDLDQFRDQLRRYYLGQDAPPMFPKVYFTVAQKWSSPDMPLHACLISIVVTPLRASEELRTISPEVHSLPLSIHSGLLQISGPGPADCSSPLGGVTTWNDISSCRMAPMSAMV